MRIGKFVNVISGVALGAMVITGFSGQNATAISGDFNANKKVDSNEWTRMALVKKSSANAYAAAYVTQMYYSTNGNKGGVADNYHKIYCRISSGGRSIIEESCATSRPKNNYDKDKGRVCIEKGPVSQYKSIMRIQQKYRKKGIEVKICLMGHDPSKDCFASGVWNIDRGTDEY